MSERELELTDKQIELFEAIEEYPVVFFGGAKGGGKSYGLRNIILVLAWETICLTTLSGRKYFS